MIRGEIEDIACRVATQHGVPRPIVGADANRFCSGSAMPGHPVGKEFRYPSTTWLSPGSRDSDGVDSRGRLTRRAEMALEVGRLRPNRIGESEMLTHEDLRHFRDRLESERDAIKSRIAERSRDSRETVSDFQFLEISARIAYESSLIADERRYTIVAHVMGSKHTCCAIPQLCLSRNGTIASTPSTWPSIGVATSNGSLAQREFDPRCRSCFPPTNNAFSASGGNRRRLVEASTHVATRVATRAAFTDTRRHMAD
jgi:hypothetical protein